LSRYQQPEFQGIQQEIEPAPARILRFIAFQLPIFGRSGAEAKNFSPAKVWFYEKASGE
jgi:hypothetical protein